MTAPTQAQIEAAKMGKYDKEWPERERAKDREIERLRAAISGAVEAIEKGSTSAPVLECLKAAIVNEQSTK